MDRVFVLRPGNLGDKIVTERRGQRVYRIRFEGDPFRMGKTVKKTEILPWAFSRLERCFELSSRKKRVNVSAIDIKTQNMPMLLPHQMTAIIYDSYPDEKIADEVESEIRKIVKDKRVETHVQLLSRRPPMNRKDANLQLFEQLNKLADEWEIRLDQESSVWPSVGGLVPPETGVLCGVGPVARKIYTPEESVDRVSLIQRTILIAEFLSQYGS